MKSFGLLIENILQIKVCDIEQGRLVDSEISSKMMEEKRKETKQ